jgi:hypothetical protein
MKARLLLRQRLGLSETAFVEVVVWQVPQAVRGSHHAYKYRLALVSEGVCVLRYDNEAGKGDHKHVGGREEPVVFTSLQRLLADFQADVEAWGKGR